VSHIATPHVPAPWTAVRAAAAALALGAVVAGLAQAQDRPLPPPPLAPLLTFAAPALEKPPVPIPRVEIPAPPEALPDLPAPRLVSDPSLRPVAPLPPPRALACNPLGSVFGVASELLECGRAKFQRGELEPARADLASAVQKSTDRELVRAARYWLAETLVRLRRGDAAEAHLALVVRDDPRGELGMHAAFTLGWVLLDRGDVARALAGFEPLLRGGAPPALIQPARHGKALALYGLKRYPEARDEWTALLNQSLPRPLAAEATFWLGETQGRLGDAQAAAARLQVFTAGGPHPLIEPGLLRLAWWRRAAGQPLEAVKTYRALLSAYPQTAEALWARAGLAQALLDVDDPAAARAEARLLETRDTAGTLARPTNLAIARWLVEKNRADDALALTQELLGRTLDPPTRAYVLLLSAEAHRQAGQPAEARAQLELVRSAPARPAFAAYATLRLAQLDLEGREFARALAAAEGLVQDPQPSVRAAALVVAAESAYWSRSYERAAALYARFRADFPKQPEAPAALLAQGWTELRRSKLDEARQLWTGFAREHGGDPRTPAVLLLAAELAAKAGDEAEARRLLDQLIARFPQDDLAPVAVLNRAILAIRAGRGEDGLRDLRGLPARATLSPHAGRIRLARGIAHLQGGRLLEAQSELQAALADGEDLARLGLGRIALERKQWDAAARELVAARDAGSGDVAAAAEYGLAAVLYGQGKKEEFVKLAAPILSGPADPATTPYLLEAMAGLSAEGKKWTEARGYALRLAQDFPKSEASPRALAALGAAASREGQWPLAREAYQALLDRYPTSPALAEGQLDLAEALLRTGAAPEARRRLETFVASPPGDPATRDARMPRALLLLAQAREATGDRAAALETYARLRQEYPGAPGADSAVMAQGRLFQAEGKWDEARSLYERALANPDAAIAAAAAYQLGEGLRAAGQHQDAVEFYMTAAYLGGDSPVARRALLGAGQSFTALRQKDAAEVVYRKLAGAQDVEPELAETARKELRALGAN